MTIGSIKSALFKVISNTPPFYKLLKTKPNTAAFEEYYTTAINILKEHKNSGNHNFRKKDLKSLHCTFRKYNVSTRRLGELWWRDFFDLLADPEEYDKKLESLTLSVQNMDCKLLTIREWCHIYAFITRMSLFKLAFEIRIKAIENALTGVNENSCSRYDFEKRIGALIEAEDFEQAYASLKIYSERFKDRNSADYMRGISEFIYSVDGSFEPLIPENMSDIDHKYRSYLSGKSVAVVGPAVVNLRNADEIDGFDDVVRFNYRQEGQGCDGVFNGEKTTMTHFNNEQTEHVVEKYDDTVPIDAGWVLIKKRVPYLNFKKAFHKNDFSIRQLRVQNGLLFYGTLHAIPNTICDMLRFRPKRVKIFNADLMITGERYKTYRHDGYAITERYEKLNEFAQSNAWHDVVAQFNLLKLLWKRGVISGDNRFEEVIKLGSERYIDEIEKEHGYLNLVNVKK